MGAPTKLAGFFSILENAGWVCTQPSRCHMGYGGHDRQGSFATGTSGTGKMVRSHHGAATVSEE
jgi:hypothetical protein